MEKEISEERIIRWVTLKTEPERPDIILPELEFPERNESITRQGSLEDEDYE